MNEIDNDIRFCNFCVISMFVTTIVVAILRFVEII